MKALNAPRKTRISTMCTPSMFKDALQEMFGEQEWITDELADCMNETMLKDLEEGRKEEYNSVVGFVSLYERSGGKMYPEVNAALAQDAELDSHPLIIRLHKYCLEWRSCNRASDQMITYEQFYSGFMATYVKCYACPLTRNALNIIDLDGNGFIDWGELVYRAKWVLTEYPEECTDIESMIRALFERYIVPEIGTALRKRYSERRLKIEHIEDDSEDEENDVSHTQEETEVDEIEV